MQQILLLLPLSMELFLLQLIQSQIHKTMLHNQRLGNNNMQSNKDNINVEGKVINVSNYSHGTTANKQKSNNQLHMMVEDSSSEVDQPNQYTKNPLTT